ncbi:hypothetical protein T02_9660 [Trichinella nativa]|uniref:Uncharacterized protein n=2 Tax=Trichinella nativa TaxID=6335 RepID=A0A0V1KPX6_9BILA|nr:hypothetical protein T02_9660 [Trichinella nativa]
MTEQHAERRLITPRLVGSCGLVARSRPRFSSAVSFELGGKGEFIAAVRRLPQLDLQLATPPYSNGCYTTFHLLVDEGAISLGRQVVVLLVFLV